MVRKAPSHPHLVAAVTPVMILLTASLAMTGCSPKENPALTAAPSVAVTSPTTVTPTPSATDLVATPVDCVDDVAIISGSAQAFTVSTDCARVEVSGSGLRIDLVDVEIGELIVRGDSNGVEVSDLTAATVEGQRNEIHGGGAGSVLVRGNANVIILTEDLGSLQISGNDNRIEAPSVGSAEVEGPDNVYPGA